MRVASFLRRPSSYSENTSRNTNSISSRPAVNSGESTVTTPARLRDRSIKRSRHYAAQSSRITYSIFRIAAAVAISDWGNAHQILMLTPGKPMPMPGP